MNVLVLASPIYMMQVYDRVIPTGNGATLILLTIIIGIALVVMSALDVVRSMILSRIGAWLDRSLAKPVMEASVLRTVRQGNSLGALGLRDIATLRALVGGPSILPLFDAPRGADFPDRHLLYSSGPGMDFRRRRHCSDRARLFERA